MRKPSRSTAPADPRPTTSDTRPFAIVVNTAPDEFLFIGANGVPKFAMDSTSAAHVAIVSKDEVRYENGKWLTGRRLNGDEIDNGLPDSGIGMLRIKLLRFE